MKDEVKIELIRSLQETNVSEKEELNQRAKSHEKAVLCNIRLQKDYADLKRKVFWISHLGRIFKRFKD